MTDKHVQAEAPHSNMEKDPSDWVTGDEPMTGAQKSYLKTLSEEAGAAFDESLTKAAASEQIDALQKETGRGASGQGASKTTHKAAATHRTEQPSAPGKGSRSKTEAGVDEPEGELFEADKGGSADRLP